MGLSRFGRLIIAGAALAGVLLGACTRPASTLPPTSEPALTPGEENWQQATMNAVRQAVMQTQTAQAGGATSVLPSETPETPETPEAPPPTSEGATQEPTEAATPAPTFSGGGARPGSYTLQEGEFPYCIARRFNVNPDELLTLNGINRGTTVAPGTTLQIPQTGNPFPATRALHSHPASYTVRSGDTIYTVACYYGDVDPMAIAVSNGLSSPYTLAAGATISIP
jgi:LysM repeat protein